MKHRKDNFKLHELRLFNHKIEQKVLKNSKINLLVCQKVNLMLLYSISIEQPQFLNKIFE